MSKQAKFKVGDKVKVCIPKDQLESFNLYDPNFSGDWTGIHYYPKKMSKYIGQEGEVTEYFSGEGSYHIKFKDRKGWCFPESFVVSVKDTSENLNGHIWLIVNKQTGKVIEGYQTRKYAREQIKVWYRNPSDFKIVKYTFN